DRCSIRRTCNAFMQCIASATLVCIRRNDLPVVPRTQSPHRGQVDAVFYEVARAVHKQEIAASCVRRVEARRAAVGSVYGVLPAVDDYGRDGRAPVLAAGQGWVIRRRMGALVV